MTMRAGPCAVVDPGDGEAVLERLQREGLACGLILLTHGHFDHIWGVQALSAATGAPVAIHEDDADKLQSSRKSLALMIGRPLPKAQASRLLHDGDTLRCGALSFRVLHTPGHSEGGVCYVLEREGVIFCGDTLFFEGVGRHGFPGRGLWRARALRAREALCARGRLCAVSRPRRGDDARA